MQCVAIRRISDSPAKHTHCKYIIFCIFSNISYIAQQQLPDKQDNGEILCSTNGFAEPTSKFPSQQLPEEGVLVIPHEFAGCSRQYHYSHQLWESLCGPVLGAKSFCGEYSALAEPSTAGIQTVLYWVDHPPGVPIALTSPKGNSGEDPNGMLLAQLASSTWRKPGWARDS